jgi:hypothetical protein
MEWFMRAWARGIAGVFITVCTTWESAMWIPQISGLFSTKVKGVTV